MIDSIRFKQINNLNFKSANSNTAFVNHSQLLDEYIGKSRQKALFPNGIENTVITQYNLPDCHLLASFDALSNNKYGIKIAEKMIKVSPDGKTADVYFNSAHGKPVNLDLEELKTEYDKLKKHKENHKKIIFLRNLKKYFKTGNKDYFGSREYSPFGVYVFENAYAKYILPDLYNEKGFAGVMLSNEYHDGNYNCLKDVLGEKTVIIEDKENSAKKPENRIPLCKMPEEEKDKIKEILKQASKYTDSYIMTLCSLTANDKKFLKKFVPWHEYSIRGVDYENNKITIVNPWDTSKTRVITFDELMNNFESFVYSKIH